MTTSATAISVSLIGWDFGSLICYVTGSTTKKLNFFSCYCLLDSSIIKA